MTLFGHPLHPMTIHFPIAFFLLGVGLTLLYLWTAHTERRQTEVERFAYWLFLLSLAATLLSSIVGLIDQSQLAIDDPRRANINSHITAGLSLLVINGLLVYMRFRWPDVLLSRRWSYVGLMSLGVIVLLLTAWLGGELVYGLRLGVRGN